MLASDDPESCLLSGEWLEALYSSSQKFQGNIHFVSQSKTNNGHFVHVSRNAMNNQKSRTCKTLVVVLKYTHIWG